MGLFSKRSAYEPQPRRIARFCTTCGKRLVERSRHAGFDPFTGEEQVRRWLACPDAKGEPDPWGLWAQNCKPKKKRSTRRR